MLNLSEQLPENYSFADSTALSADEVIGLRDACGWGTERSEKLWKSVIDQSIATVGVRDENDSLIGIGFLAGNPRHAILCDFIVHPEHQGRGVGKAILSKRINIAEQLDIPYLYTELAPTNKLRTFYEEVGFVATGNVYSRAARRHPSELT